MVLAMDNMDWGGAIGKHYVQVSMHGINGMGLMVLFWLVVMYYEIEWSGGWKRCAVNARHSILLPLGRHPSMVIVHFGFAVVKPRDSGVEGTARLTRIFKAIG
jgi:hypothetical protein